MTPDEREQVVELLRCAADLGNRNEGLVLSAAVRLGKRLDGPEVEIARRTWNAVFVPGMDDEEAILEAAARVEEGSWP